MELYEEFYEQKTLRFLEKTNTEVKIEPIGLVINKDWKENKPRMAYEITLFNSKGSYTFVFYDSFKNSEIFNMDLIKFLKLEYDCRPEDMDLYNRRVAQKELLKLKQSAKPNEYEVLYCLNKINPGTFKQFCLEYGYDEDSISARNIYIGMIEEYKNLQKLFTEEQLNELIRVIG